MNYFDFLKILLTPNPIIRCYNLYNVLTIYCRLNLRKRLTNYAINRLINRIFKQSFLINNFVNPIAGPYLNS